MHMWRIIRSGGSTDFFTHSYAHFYTLRKHKQSVICSASRSSQTLERLASENNRCPPSGQQFLRVAVANAMEASGATQAALSQFLLGKRCLL